MRLVDCDQLREVLADCAAEAQLTETEVRRLCDEAGTVCCDTCDHWRRDVGRAKFKPCDYGVLDPPLKWPLPDFGCAHYRAKEKSDG